MGDTVNIFWFRRDLRLNDNHGLYKALSSGRAVLPLFIFDTAILDGLPATDRRVNFIYESIQQINALLKLKARGLLVYYGNPEVVFKSLFSKYTVEAIYTNTDYEPYALQRDEQIKQIAFVHKAEFYSFKDHVIFEKDEVIKHDATPYKVFTPYSRSWKSRLSIESIPYWPSEKLLENFITDLPENIPTLTEMHFEPVNFHYPKIEIDTNLLTNYEKTRNFPAADATTHLGMHLRFGTLSIREAVKAGAEYSETWLNELIWREFFMHILFHYPRVIHQSFKPVYDRIAWRNNETEFELWKLGKTGYPLVDAGMRELVQTGFMHNRVRMVTASFLTKHLLIDWRWGESWFALHLLDYELASNNGNWQWAAGTGCDAAPYFRIFNPLEQAAKFDSEEKYVKRWVPEIHTIDYPASMVEHKMARERCLNTYKQALKP
ncbi:MAG: deoxyribodipyrimidine photo-lyase [Lentimicrobiaceae bacterium]|nr:deoxyribodipyrimidine photo-lyase [Lentimicrobiaceae bacterium]